MAAGLPLPQASMWTHCTEMGVSSEEVQPGFPWAYLPHLRQLDDPQGCLNLCTRAHYIPRLTVGNRRVPTKRQPVKLPGPAVAIPTPGQDSCHHSLPWSSTTLPLGPTGSEGRQQKPGHPPPSPRQRGLGACGTGIGREARWDLGHQRTEEQVTKRLSQQSGGAGLCVSPGSNPWHMLL